MINYDLPNVPESYVHRIGRTARAGAAGLAISFCNDEERAYLRDIEKLTRLKVPVAALPAGFSAGADGGASRRSRPARWPSGAACPRPQGHGAPRQAEPNAERGPKRRRGGGGSPPLARLGRTGVTRSGRPMRAVDPSGREARSAPRGRPRRRPSGRLARQSPRGR